MAGKSGPIKAGIDKAVILCGGKGTRLRPLTNSKPKPLVLVQGKPIVEHIFDLLKKYGIRDVVLSVGFMKEKMMSEKERWEKMGISITFVPEDEPLGTGGPLRLMSGMLKSTFVLSNGDELKDINLKEMYESHRKNNALVTIAIKEVEDPSPYGIARLDEDRITEFVEKPDKDIAPSNFANAGLYIIEPEVNKMVPGGFVSLEKDIFPQIAHMGKLFGFRFSGQWFDTGTHERLVMAEKEWRGISTG